MKWRPSGKNWAPRWYASPPANFVTGATTPPEACTKGGQECGGLGLISMEERAHSVNGNPHAPLEQHMRRAGFEGSARSDVQVAAQADRIPEPITG
jgi:hypothetical protein